MLWLARSDWNELSGDMMSDPVRNRACMAASICALLDPNSRGQRVMLGQGGWGLIFRLGSWVRG